MLIWQIFFHRLIRPLVRNVKADPMFLESRRTIHQRRFSPVLPAVIFFTIPVPNVVRIEPGRKGKTSMAFPIFVRPAGIVITSRRDGWKGLPLIRKRSSAILKVVDRKRNASLRPFDSSYGPTPDIKRSVTGKVLQCSSRIQPSSNSFLNSRRPGPCFSRIQPIHARLRHLHCAGPANH